MQPRTAVASLYDKNLSRSVTWGPRSLLQHCEGARHTGALTPQWEAGSKGLTLLEPPFLHL